jgi:hypothetical protein
MRPKGLGIASETAMLTDYGTIWRYWPVDTRRYFANVGLHSNSPTLSISNNQNRNDQVEIRSLATRLVPAASVARAILITFGAVALANMLTAPLGSSIAAVVGGEVSLVCT